MKMAVSDQQHQSSVGTLQAALRHQENRCRSLQEELSVVQETLKKRDEEFESYKVCRHREVFGIMQQGMQVLIHGQLTRTIVEGGVTTAPSVLVYHMFVYAPGYLRMT